MVLVLAYRALTTPVISEEIIRTNHQCIPHYQHFLLILLLLGILRLTAHLIHVYQIVGIGGFLHFEAHEFVVGLGVEGVEVFDGVGGVVEGAGEAEAVVFVGAFFDDAGFPALGCFHQQINRPRTRLKNSPHHPIPHPLQKPLNPTFLSPPHRLHKRTLRPRHNTISQTSQSHLKTLNRRSRPIHSPLYFRRLDVVFVEGEGDYLFVDGVGDAGEASAYTTYYVIGVVDKAFVFLLFDLTGFEVFDDGYFAETFLQSAFHLVRVTKEVGTAELTKQIRL